MGMSRKDYKLIAEVIRNFVDHSEACSAEFEAASAIAAGLADAFHDGANPNFDDAKFLEAALG